MQVARNGIRIKAPVISMVHETNIGKPPVTKRRIPYSYYTIGYEFTDPKTKRKYSRQTRVEGTKLNLSQDTKDIEQNGLDVVYRESDPNTNMPACVAHEWASDRMIVFLVFAFVGVLVGGFFLLATFLPKDVLKQRLDSGYAEM